VRWYLGYDLHEPLPDHSSLTRIRERYGIHIFRQFFEVIVDRCAEDGLIWGQELFADATFQGRMCSYYHWAAGAAVHTTPAFPTLVATP
jgi:hypothetical protein